MSKYRVCVIGAGPSGMAALYQYTKLNAQKGADVVCYDKQSTWGGMWNYSWCTGTDEFGEVCHNSLYRHIWINGPKETYEMADYTFKEHYGKPVPSYLPMEKAKLYFEARWKKDGSEKLRRHIKFNHAVRFVRYNEASNDFKVLVYDMKNHMLNEETFSHIIVASGIFSTPNKPTFPGLENFKGRILHSHDFREPNEFKNQRLLIIGGSYSAEDIGMLCKKYGSKDVIISHRTGKSIRSKWPSGIQERPGIKQILETSVVFDDDSSADVDVIVLCTGYKYWYPFLDKNLQIMKPVRSSYYPEQLYKGVVWIGGGNNKLFYIGAQNQKWAAPMFDVQAEFIWRYIFSELPTEPICIEDMKSDTEKWIKKNSKVAGYVEAVGFQEEYMKDLHMITGRTETLSTDIFYEFYSDKTNDIGTFKDKCYASAQTGQMAVKNTLNWFENIEDYVDC